MQALHHLAFATAGSILATLAILATHTFAADRAGEAELIRWSVASREFPTEGSLEIMADEAVWKRLAHVFFNAKEFIYYR